LSIYIPRLNPRAKALGPNQNKNDQIQPVKLPKQKVFVKLKNVSHKKVRSCYFTFENSRGQLRDLSVLIGMEDPSSFDKTIPGKWRTQKQWRLVVFVVERVSQNVIYLCTINNVVFKECKFIKKFSTNIKCYKMNYIVKLLLISKIKLLPILHITIFKH
jgi:hypothetical protein